ncbi:MAG TPA: hypothetical protein VFI22_12570, partial [Thermomicrobiales bacterium]|nr:hypothetical protein [Thermomicrobiales bacterium]
VLAIAAQQAELAERFVIPFADDAIVRRILDKSTLYRAAREAGVPIPRTCDTRLLDDAAAMAEVGLPCVLKPAAKRPFYDAIGANLFVVETPAEFSAWRQQGEDFGMLAQELIPATADDYVTVGLAVGPDGQALGSYVGQRLEIAPAGFGTTCLARGIDLPELEAQALAIVQRFGYWGIAEVEFLRDPRSGVFTLLDLNTRPWKWIGLPIAAGVDLPGLLYAAALGRPVAIPERRPDLMWTSLKDYVPLRARGEAMQPGDPIGRERWLQLIAGAPEATAIDAILDRADPEPAYRALQGVFGLYQYSCPC